MKVTFLKVEMESKTCIYIFIPCSIEFAHEVLLKQIPINRKLYLTTHAIFIAQVSAEEHLEEVVVTHIAFQKLCVCV